MESHPRLAAHDLPDPLRAMESGRADPIWPFPAELEQDYALTRLKNDRTLIRAGVTAGLALTLARTGEQVLGGSVSPMLLAQLGLVVAVSLTLVVLAWGPAFERRYLPFAQVIVPIRCTLAAAHFAIAAANGELALLMVMPLLVIGPFFFLGLRFRAALTSGILVILSFASCAVLSELPLPTALRASFFLTFALIATAFTARQIEKWARRSFLEHRRIAEFARQDGLTGMNNRRVFDEHLERMWQCAAEHNCLISILVGDIDHFKAFNDRYGHMAGDDALRRVAGALASCTRRPLDITARYGGEEFAAVLYDIDSTEAAKVAERMRQAVIALGISHQGSQTSDVITISIGVASVRPCLKRSWGGALQLADQAMYEAKQKGRNRVALTDQIQHESLVTGTFEAYKTSRWRKAQAVQG